MAHRVALVFARTLWLLDAVARRATAASSDFFCVPFRRARQRARLPTVQTTPPLAPGALYGAFAPQAATRTPTASSACGSVRLPPAARKPAACAPQAAARRPPLAERRTPVDSQQGAPCALRCTRLLRRVNFFVSLRDGMDLGSSRSSTAPSSSPSASTPTESTTTAIEDESVDVVSRRSQPCER